MDPMSLSPTLLRALTTVDEHGSIARAAAALHYSQPALSRQLVRLERVAGTRLLRRSPSGTTLTAAGHELARLARSVLGQLERFPSEAPTRPGPLRLGVFATACVNLVPQAIAEAAREVAEIDLRLAAVPDPFTALALDEIDLALMARWDADPVAPAHVAVTALRDEELLLLTPTRDDRAGTTVADGDIVDETWVDGPHPDCLGPAPLPGAGADIGLHASTWSDKVRAVAQRQALSLVPDTALAVLPASVRVAHLRSRRRRTVCLAVSREGSRHPYAGLITEALVSCARPTTSPPSHAAR
jgi:DNA-binding transcriptional LysR family regulator